LSLVLLCLLFFFFFQAEDGIRDKLVTGVQTCALPISQYTLTGYDASAHMTEETTDAEVSGPKGIYRSVVISVIFGWILLLGVWRSEERRVGKECRGGCGG